jgi:hypothetical protein
MPSRIDPYCGPLPAGRALAADLCVLMALFGAAMLLGVLIHGRDAVAHEAVEVLAFAAGVAASILLAAAAAITGNGRTGRLAGAVALYAGVALLVRAAGLEDPMNIWVLASSAAVLGSLGMLVLGVRGPVTGRAGRWAAGTVGGITVTTVATITAFAVVLPGRMPPPWAVGALDVVAWSGAAAAGLVGLVVGARTVRPLVRRTGIAFLTLSAAHAVRIVTGGAPGSDRGAVVAALELAAVMMLLLAAVALFVAVLTAIRRPHSARPLPAVAKAPERRDGERRPDRLALSGAVRNILGGRTDGSAADGARLLAAERTPVARPDDAAGDRHKTGAARRRTRDRGHRRPLPGRGRPPGRPGAA